MKASWYEFRPSSSADSAHTNLFIYDSIGAFGVSASQFLADLQSVPADSRIVLRIHSPGGDVFDGQAIFTALKRHAGGVTTHIDGLAASMAAVIAMAGDPVQMAGNGMFMIHNVGGGAMGESEDLRKAADMMDKVQETITQIFVGKTGLSRKRLTELMDSETWLTASEALEMGFVDEITGEMKMAAEFDLSKFKNSPRLTEKLAAMSKPTVAELTETISQLEVAATASQEAISKLETENTEGAAAVATLTASLTEASAKVEGFVELTTKLEAEKVELTNLNVTLTARVTELEASQKTVEQAAREIAARNGADLPAKTVDKTIDKTKPDFSQLKGLAKTTAIFASRMPSHSKPL